MFSRNTPNIIIKKRLCISINRAYFWNGPSHETPVGITFWASKCMKKGSPKGGPGVAPEAKIQVLKFIFFTQMCISHFYTLNPSNNQYFKIQPNPHFAFYLFLGPENQTFMIPGPPSDPPEDPPETSLRAPGDPQGDAIRPRPLSRKRGRHRHTHKPHPPRKPVS